MSSVSFSSGIFTLTGDPSAGNYLTVNLNNGGATATANADNHLLTESVSSITGIKITGGSSSDYIYIDSGLKVPATINSGDGNDEIRGSGGADSITAGNGSDWISGQGTTNYISVGNGNDVILGAAGPDTVVTGSGNDSVNTADGNDQITVGNGNDSVTAGSGNDSVVAGNGVDILDGGEGNDHLTVGTGASTVIPADGTNYVVVGSSLATVVPFSGSDTTIVNSSGTPVTPPVTSTPPTTASTKWVSYSAPTGSGTNPTAVMQVLAPAPTVGIDITVRALNSTLGIGTPIDANYAWNFGDAGSEYNSLPGFNASHVYTQAGNYTITLTVTNNLGQSSTVTSTIAISADTRRAIYVNSSTGNDSNNGSTPDLAVKTATQAGKLIGNNTEVFFDRGQVFNLPSTIELTYNNVLVGAYGSGAQPIINYTSVAAAAVTFDTNSTSAQGVTIQDLTLTTLYGTAPTGGGQPMGVQAGGYGTSVLRCTFDYEEYDVNASGGPVGLLLQDNTSPLAAGLEGYFLWNQGIDVSVLGNTVASSVHEHILRQYGGQESLIYDNNFTNLDGKGCIEIQLGAYAWIDSNTVNYGDIRVGPLGLWGEPTTDSTSDCVIQNNHINNIGINSYPGSEHISIRNNILTNSAVYPSTAMINVIGQSSAGFQSSDIRILNNTAYNPTSSTSVFLSVQSHTNGIILENNLLVQPNLAVGGYGTAPVYDFESDLSSFTYINGNVWQLPKTFYQWAEGGINFVGTSYVQSGYKTPDEWNAYSQVGTDFFSDTAIDTSNFAPSTSSLAATADSAIAGVFGDIDGNTRPTSGSWSAGAVQV